MKKRKGLIWKIPLIILGVLTVAFGVLSVIPIKTTMINHRGFSNKAPENTLSAYRLSAEKGYKFVECDVTFTADGVPVLLHDDTVDRTTGRTLGENIRDLTYEQVLQFDFGYEDKFGDKFKGEKIPTFYEFISLCEELSLSPYIEIKNKSGAHAYTDEQIKHLIDTVKASSLTEVTWISFNYDILLKIKEFDQRARLGYTKNKITDEVITDALSLKSDSNEVFINANFGYLTPRRIRAVKKAGLGLEVWTVNIRALAVILSPFVDAITTNNIIYK